jgi:hypothetical protein
MGRSASDQEGGLRLAEAGGDVVRASTLEQLPASRFNSPNDVSEALGKVA